MPATRQRLPAILRVALTAGLLAVATRLPAAEGGFVATVPSDQQLAAGLTGLSVSERQALDQLVAVELDLARHGGSGELAGTFSSRRSQPELKSTGLDRLTPPELAKLDELVAAALAARPKPKERPRIRDSDVFNPAPKPEIHGSFSLTYGRGSGGRSFHGSSFEVNYFDPAKGFGLYVGVANISGKGFYYGYPDYYDSPYYPAGPFYFENSGIGVPRDNFSYGDGQSLRSSAEWNSPGRGFWHR